MKKLRQLYMNLHIQTKLMIVILLAVTIPALFVLLFFYSRMYGMVVSYTIRQEQDASATTAPLIEEMVEEVVTVSDRLSDLEFYGMLFHQPINEPVNGLSQSESAAEFQEEIEKIKEDGLITAVRIYMDFPDEDSALFTDESTKDILSPMSQAQGTYWYGILKGTNASSLHCPSFYLGTKEKEQYGDMAYIRVTTFYYEGETHTAYIAVYYSSDDILEILSENLSLDGSVSYIINERDNIVASSDTSLSGLYWLSYETIESAFMSSNNFIERTILDETVYVGFYSITESGWFMVTILPSDPLIAQSNRIIRQFAHLYLAVVLVAILCATLLSHSITRRIASVSSQMNAVREGPPQPMASPDAHDEVGNLIDTYNYMAMQINNLLAEQTKAAEDLRISEFNSLQAQINPHFLYNTMDMINWLAQQGRTAEVSSAVQDLSRFYKLTLSRRQTIATIASEIEHVTIYARLQNMRYHDSFSLITDIPDDLTDYLIPKLTLQPVVENAILHGILEKDSKSGTIVITGWMEDEDIVLLISDDGVGMSQETLQNILYGTGPSASGGTNIAIYNTHRRLQILYGSSYGLKYSSTVGKGTDVQIRIPAQKEYHTPYTVSGMSGTSIPAAKPLVAIAMPESISGASSSLNAVSPETLLDYSQEITQNLYSIQSLHQISEKLPADENLYILTHTVTEDFPNHTHSYYELNYLCSGTLINVIDHHEIYMTAGDLVFLNRSAVHALRCTQPGAVLINFCLKPELFERTLHAFMEEKNLISDFINGTGESGQNFIFFSLGHSLQPQTILTSIIQEYADNQFHQSFTLEAYFLLLFSYLANSEEFSYSGVDSDTSQMLQYLRDNFDKKNIREIAGHFMLTSRQLDEHLKTHTGRSLQDFSDELRLERAVKLLENHNDTIYQIAELCGFQSTDEFTQIFYQKYQVTPTEYRRQFL
ncbi:MAG: histidine kinase [Lachnospiraceae bacterium]|nr:histidine kinase [Lachnospiraceae bacterium]